MEPEEQVKLWAEIGRLATRCETLTTDLADLREMAVGHIDALQDRCKRLENQLAGKGPTLE